MVQEPFRSVSDPSGRTKPTSYVGAPKTVRGLVVFVLCTSARNALDGRRRCPSIAVRATGMTGYWWA